MISAADAIERLRAGNRRYVDGETENGEQFGEARRAASVDGQSPFAIVLACSDSRVPVEMIFDQGLGDLFVIRVAGNIVAPSQIGSIEFAVQQFGTRLVVVLGHSHCGAIIATLDELSLGQTRGSSNLRAIVDRIRPAVEDIAAQDRDVTDPATVSEAVRANVGHSVERLQYGSRIIESLIKSGELEIAGAEYSIENGTVEFLDGQ